VVGAERAAGLEHRLAHGADGVGDLVDGRRPAQLRRQTLAGPLDPETELLQIARDADGPRLVAEMALELPEDRRHGVARERDAARAVEAVDGVDEPEAGDLVEVVERLVRVRVARRELAGQRQEAPDDHVAVHRARGVVVPREQLAVAPQAFAAVGRARSARRGGRSRCLHISRDRPSIPRAKPSRARVECTDAPRYEDATTPRASRRREACPARSSSDVRTPRGTAITAHRAAIMSAPDTLPRSTARRGP
jgi:hypothetical protein